MHVWPQYVLTGVFIALTAQSIQRRQESIALFGKNIQSFVDQNVGG